VERLTIDCQRRIQRDTKVRSVLFILLEKDIVALPITARRETQIHTMFDCLDIDLFQLSHHSLSTLFSNRHVFLQTLVVDIVHVVEEEMIVLFITQLSNYVENATFPKIFLDKNLVRDVWVEVLFIGVGRRKAVLTIRNAMGLFDFLRACVALEGQNARDEDSLVTQSVLVLVHFQDKIGIQIHYTSVKECVADSLNITFGDINVCFQNYLRIEVGFTFDELNQLLAICFINQERWDRNGTTCTVVRTIAVEVLPSRDKTICIFGDKKGLYSHFLDSSGLFLVSAATVLENNKAAPIHVVSLLYVVWRNHIFTAICFDVRIKKRSLDRGPCLEPPKLCKLSINRT